MLIILFFIFAFLTIAGYFSGSGWWFDLISHFRLQYFIFQIFFLVFFLMIRNMRFILLSLIFLLINASQLSPFYLHKPNLEYRNMIMHGKLKILFLNMHEHSKDYPKVMEYIYAVNPDILAMDGFTQEDLSGLNNVVVQYSHQKHTFTKDGPGLGIFSKIPFEDFQTKYYGSDMKPAAVAQFRIDREILSFLVFHLTPPLNEMYFHRRNDQLARIAEEHSARTRNIIMIGDFNTGAWSKWFQDFLKKTHLRDAALGFGIHPTYPAQWPLLAIPIDHCLVSKNFSVLDYQRGPDLGLGHYPLSVEVGVFQSDYEN